VRGQPASREVWVRMPRRAKGLRSVNVIPSPDGPRRWRAQSRSALPDHGLRPRTDSVWLQGHLPRPHEVVGMRVSDPFSPSERGHRALSTCDWEIGQRLEIRTRWR
jgi:hypothetical protein